MSQHLVFSLLFCFLLALASASEAPTGVYEHPPMNCFPTNCGNVTNITYPFWVEKQQPSHCGYPAFKLTCINNTPMLEMSTQMYQVKKIFYEEQSVVLADAKLINNPCPIQYSNTSFSATPFSISSVNKQITILFECSGTPPDYYGIPCAANKCNHTFVHIGDQLGLSSSCEMAIMPVLDYRELAVRDYMMLLENGFLANWTAPDCRECIRNHGQCGYSNETDNFMCICHDGAHLTSCTPRNSFTKLAIGLGLIGFLLVSLLLAFCVHKHTKVCSSISFCVKNLNDSQNIEEILEEYGSVFPRRYTYSQVKRITKAFKEKLGEGGYGTVFKGTLSDGQLVAVKMLNDSRGNGEEFMNEVASIGRTSHVNVISLLGFCYEGNKRSLIYNYMCNGSLDKFLDSEKTKTIFDWEKLYQIAIDIARGLEYLHRGCNTRIVHFDIKPHNILLNQDFCPKISDFGLAKSCLMRDSTISIAGARGTAGYIAPEVFSRNFGVVSSKSDVYSYGMMVLEMAEGKKNPNPVVEDSNAMYFPHQIYEYLDQGRDLQAYGVPAESEVSVRKMILVGLWCIQTLPHNRPSMSRVIEMLEGHVNDLQLPPRPYLYSFCSGSFQGISSIQDNSSIDDNSEVHS